MAQSNDLKTVRGKVSDTAGETLAVGTDLSDGYYVCGYGPQSILGCFDESAQLINKYELTGVGLSFIFLDERQQ